MTISQSGYARFGCGRAYWVLGLVAMGLMAGACGGAGKKKANHVVVMTGEEESDIKPDPPAPPIRLNQVGYLPGLPKIAVIGTAETKPLDWSLVDAQGKVLATGKTVPTGVDRDSGDALQRIDFSSFTGTGKGLVLKVGKDSSAPFDVRPDIYKQLKLDAMWYFYHSRSGIAIELPYAGEQKWVRPAAHVSDKSVPCAKDSGCVEPGAPKPTNPEPGCTYSLNVMKGWYDAGDHGKYVVNGGIAAFTLLSAYERMQSFGKSSLPDFADGKLRIPEKDNKVPDILDEARWEVEFLLGMQVPEGQPLAGMAHHKMHDTKWSGLGYIPPAEATKDNPRILRPPSTAATLNLAAVAAQAARIYKPFDAEFSKRCLAAAERAWKAALANPSRFAPRCDTVGGGPYDDKRVTDEFYWAAVELFVTTGRAEFRDYLKASPFHNHIPDGSGDDGKGVMTPMTWQSVSGLGTMTLALVNNGLPKADIEAARKEITRHADAYLASEAKSGYLTPLFADETAVPSEMDRYPWGSNSFVINDAISMALAWDFTKDKKYLAGAAEAMNVLLGRNAMGRSYVTGYGSNPTRNPHHRFWAHQEFADYPDAPPGILSGGPNSRPDDPSAAAAKLDGCKPMKCYVDHINSWSTNEITINWNAPLVWMATFLDEVGH
jgi:endoglucanase